MKFSAINVYDSLRPIFICSKLFGLCSFSIGIKEWSKTRTAMIFPILATILFTTHSLSELHMREIDERLLIYVLTDYFHTYAGVISTIVIYLLSIFLRNKVSC